MTKIVGDERSVECYDLLGKYTTDVIGNCVFGIDMNALKDEESEFFVMGRKIFTHDLKHSLRNAMKQLTPSLYGLVGHLLQQKEVDAYFINLFTNSIKYRRENKVVRRDFMQLLIELQDHPDQLDNIGECMQSEVQVSLL